MVCGFDIAGKTDMGNIQERGLKKSGTGRNSNTIAEMHLSRRGQEIELCRIVRIGNIAPETQLLEDCEEC